MAENRFGGFEVISEIGRGGMGVVYRARQISLDREVALKTLMPGLEPDAALIARFRAEARAASRINHPNLVQIHDVGQEGQTHYLAMELVDGESLSSLVRREGPMDYLRAAAVGSQVAAALGALHSAGIVHRDVKPSNTLVRPDGLAKLTDFGVALLHREARRMTADGTTVGTADYMSPEQARGEDLDGRSDIYSLGVVLYHLLAGKVPFSADTPLAVMKKHCEEPVPVLRRVRPDVPDKLAAIVMRCLAKDPADRYQTAEAMAADLDHLRLELEFAALSADTPTRGMPSLFSTQAVASMRRDQQDGKPLALRWGSRLARAVASAGRYVAGSFDRDVAGLRQAAGEMEQALAALAEAKQRRSDLRKQAEGLRRRAEQARAQSGEAFDADETPRAEELAEEEKRLGAMAVDYEGAAESLNGTVAQLEESYKAARDDHERLRMEVDLKRAQVIGDSTAQRGSRGRWHIAAALGVLALLTAVYFAAVAGRRPQPPTVSPMALRSSNGAGGPVSARDPGAAPASPSGSRPATLPMDAWEGWSALFWFPASGNQIWNTREEWTLAEPLGGGGLMLKNPWTRPAVWFYDRVIEGDFEAKATVCLISGEGQVALRDMGKGGPKDQGMEFPLPLGRECQAVLQRSGGKMRGFIDGEEVGLRQWLWGGSEDVVGRFVVALNDSAELVLRSVDIRIGVGGAGGDPAEGAGNIAQWQHWGEPPARSRMGSGVAASLARPRSVLVPPGFQATPKSGAEPYTNTGWAQEIVHEVSDIELVFIPAGEFLMGKPAGEDAATPGNPQHRVRITRPFYMGKCEVSQRQWTRVMGSNPSGFTGNNRLPLEKASWGDIQVFLEKAGAGLRLPTEAEWEYACRAGTTTAYCFGDSEDYLEEYAWFMANSDNSTHPIGAKRANAWGLCDMYGNVWEWCQDWHGLLTSDPVADPEGPPDGTFRVLRGGSWYNRSVGCASASRTRSVPDSRRCLVGFRVALSLE